LNPPSGNSSIETLYEEHQPWLLGWLRRRLGCGETAADLAQDTFVRLLARPRELDGARNVRSYLGTIAKGLCIDHWRRRRLEQVWLETLAAQPEAVALSPEHHALVLETLAEVEAMLRQLPPKVADAFLMAQLQGMRYAAIATALDVSERMVKKYMARALLHCALFEASLEESTRRSS